MKNKKYSPPKTRTVFGVKCKQTFIYGLIIPYWKGENEQYVIEVYDRSQTQVSYRHPSEKRYFVEVMLKTFHNIRLKTEGSTLKECQKETQDKLINVMDSLKNILDNIHMLNYKSEWTK